MRHLPAEESGVSELCRSKEEGIVVSRVQLVPGGIEGERADSFRNWWSMGGSVIVANNAKSFYQILPRPPSPLSSSLFLLGDDRKCVQVQLLACP